MGRPRKVVRTVRKHLWLPEDVVAKVDLLLYSEVDGGVPFAAWQTLLTNLLNRWIEENRSEQVENNGGSEGIQRGGG